MQPVSCTAVLNLGRFWWCADLKRQGERHVGSYVQASISLCQSNATLHISAQLSRCVWSCMQTLTAKQQTPLCWHRDLLPSPHLCLAVTARVACLLSSLVASLPCRP